MNHPIVRIVAPAVHLAGHNLDTDRIVPARFLKTVSFEELADALFYDDRLLNGQPDPAHPLHRSPQAGILLVDENFGCGSSREHAAQAIKRWGIQAIVGRSFGDIFHGNCQHLGIPCLEVDAVIHQDIVQYLGYTARRLTISLQDLSIHPEGQNKAWSCQLSTDSQQAYLHGTYDPLQALLANHEKTLVYAKNHPAVPSIFF